MSRVQENKNNINSNLQNDFLSLQKHLQGDLEQTTHVIIKLGTNTIAPHINSLDFFTALAEQIKLLQEQNKKVLIVSSGAVGLGKKLMFSENSAKEKTDFNPSRQFSLTEKQAFASLGQSQLIDIYRKGFAPLGLLPAQILVSAFDFNYNEPYRNLKNTLDQLLNWNAVPIINENDALATYGLKVGDNDTLSALITSMYQKSILILLTTIDGFYMDNQKIDVISELTTQHYNAAGSPSQGGIGGMRTKLHAGKRLLVSGQIMNISSGENPKIIQNIMRGEKIGTWFYALNMPTKLSGKKRWLLHNNHPQGTLTIDDGAKDALINCNASLLAVGIISAQGNFNKGDLIAVQDKQTAVFAKGIISCDSFTLQKILAEKDFTRGEEIVHRDNFVLLR